MDRMWTLKFSGNLTEGPVLACSQLALQAGEESGNAAPVVKGTKKKKKKAGGKMKMSKEEAIAAAQEAQAAAAAALLKGISHEDAAKAAEAALQVRALVPFRADMQTRGLSIM